MAVISWTAQPFVHGHPPQALFTFEGQTPPLPPIDLSGIISLSDLTVTATLTPLRDRELIGICVLGDVSVSGTLAVASPLIGVVQLADLSVTGTLTLALTYSGRIELGDVSVVGSIRVPMLSGVDAWYAAAAHSATLQGTSGQFAPIILVTMVGFGRTFASREVPFLTAELMIKDIVAGGIGSLTTQLDENTHKVQVSGTTLSLVNVNNLAGTFVGPLLNSRVEMRLGFVGLEYTDYLLIATLIVDRYQSTYDGFQLQLIDTTIKEAVNLSLPIGQQYFPGAPQASRSKNIPIVVGVLVDAPTIQVSGDATGTLAFDILAADTFIDIIESGASFPATGTVSVGTEVDIEYDTRMLVNVYGTTYLRLTDLTRPNAADHIKGELITLTNVQYVYLLGFGVSLINQVRDKGDITGVLAASLTTVSTEVDIVGLGTSFPLTGVINIGTELGVIYTTKVNVNVGGQDRTRFGGLTRPTPITHNVGVRVRLANATAAVVDPTEYVVSTMVVGGKDVTILTFQSQRGEVTVDVNAANIDTSNIVNNGDFEIGDTTGWTDGTGGTLAVDSSAPSAFGGTYRGAVVGQLNEYGAVYQDVEILAGELYDYRFAYRNTKALSEFVDYDFETGFAGWTVVHDFNAVLTTLLANVLGRFGPATGSYALEIKYAAENSLLQNYSFEDNPGVAATNLIVNSTFPTTGVSTPWVTANGGIATVKEGANQVELKGGTNSYGDLYQDITVQSGAVYKLVFRYRNVKQNSLFVNGHFQLGVVPATYVLLTTDTFEGWVKDIATNVANLRVQYQGSFYVAYILFSPPSLTAGLTDYVGTYQWHQDVEVLNSETYTLSFDYGTAHLTTSVADVRRFLEKRSVGILDGGSFSSGMTGGQSGNVFNLPEPVGFTCTQMSNASIILHGVSTFSGYSGHFIIPFSSDGQTYYQGTGYGYPTIANGWRVPRFHEDVCASIIVFFGPWNAFPYGRILPAGTDAVAGVPSGPYTVGIDDTRVFVIRQGTYLMQTDVHLTIGQEYNFSFQYETMYGTDTYQTLGVNNWSKIEYMLEGITGWLDVGSTTQYTWRTAGDPPSTPPYLIGQPLSIMLFGINGSDVDGTEGWQGLSTSPTHTFTATTASVRIHFRITGTYTYVPSNRTFYYSKARLSSVVCYKTLGYDPNVDLTTDLEYAVGTPADAVAYQGWTALNNMQARTISANVFLGTSAATPFEFVAVGTSARVSFRATGEVTCRDTVPFSSYVAIGNVKLLHGSDIYESRTGVQIGTPADPDLYYSSDLQATFTPLFHNTSFLTSDTTVRVTLRSQQLATIPAPTELTQIALTLETIVPHWSLVLNQGARVLRVPSGGPSAPHGGYLLFITGIAGPPYVDEYTATIVQEFTTVVGQEYAFTLAYMTPMATSQVQSGVTIYTQVVRGDIEYSVGTPADIDLYIHGFTGQSHGYTNGRLYSGPAFVTGGGIIGNLSGGSSPPAGYGYIIQYYPVITTPILIYCPYVRFVATTTTTRVTLTFTSRAQFGAGTNPTTFTDGPVLTNRTGNVTNIYCDDIEVVPVYADVPLFSPSYIIPQGWNKAQLHRPLVYKAIVTQDVDVLNDEPYTFSFAYVTIRDNISSFTVPMSRYSDIQYKLGTPANDELYVPLTAVGQSHTTTNGLLVGPGPFAFARTPTQVITTEDTTARLTLIITGRAVRLDGQPPPWQRVSGGFLEPQFPPAPVYLDDVQLVHGDVPNLSTARVLIGTPTTPDAYRTLTLTPRFNWAEVKGILTPGATTVRITLESRYSVSGDDFATYFDSIAINSVFSYSHLAGGENPIDAIVFMMATFTPEVELDIASFNVARQLLADWKFGALYTNPGWSTDLYQEMARQCKSLLVKDAQGRYTITVLDEQRPIVMRFTPLTILPQPAFVRQSRPNDTIYTSVYVYFGTKTGGSTSPGDFASVTFATPTESSAPNGDILRQKCAAALNFFGKDRRLDFFASWVQDLHTANQLLAWLVDRSTIAQDGIFFTVWCDSAPLRLGQLVAVQHPLLGSGDNAGVANFIIEVQRFSIFNFFTFIELFGYLIGVEPPPSPTVEDFGLLTTLNEPVLIALYAYAHAAPGVALDFLSIDLNPSASGPQAVFYAENAEGAQGTFTADTTGMITFEPGLDEVGVIECQYTIRDVFGSQSNVGTMSITVLPFVGAAVPSHGTYTLLSAAQRTASGVPSGEHLASLAAHPKEAGVSAPLEPWATLASSPRADLLDALATSPAQADASALLDTTGEEP